ncbi:hypothetical protein JXI42_10560 [bacterium]|nr:hypothetical protein [bacterium]
MQTLDELCGYYELYTHQKFYPFRVYVQDGALMGHQEGREPVTITPIDTGNLLFSAYNGTEYFRTTFYRNDAGKVTMFKLAGEDWEDTARLVSNEPRPSVFSIEDLQADFREFRRILETEHCCLYEYTNKDFFDSLFFHQYSLIDRPMGLTEFFRILTPLTAKVGCGHTAVWMPSYYWDMGAENLFPIRIRIIEGNAVVIGSYDFSEHLPFGSILLSINGKPVKDIVEEIAANYSADAFNRGFIISQVERRFPMLYARRFGFPDSFEVEYVWPDLKTEDDAILKPTHIEYVRRAVFENFNHPDITMELIEDKNAAILTIKTFIYYDRVDYFTGLIDSCFDIIRERGIENLILDLRGNDGGDPFCAAHLFSYLEPEPLPYYAEAYEKYADLAAPIPLAENRFTGNLYTLMDSRCFSTNGHFCALLKYHKIGKFVGTPSGGTYKCNAGKDMDAHLRNTRMMVYFGRSTFAAAVKGMDKIKPIMPDYSIAKSYKDILTRRDVFMDKVWDLIEKK